MNCTELDVLHADAHGLVAAHHLDVVALGLVSLVLLAFGERLVRPLAALTAAAAASLTAFAAAATGDCATRVALAAAAGGVAALLALCLLRKGLLLVGAAGFGTVAHYLYDALPAIPGLAPTAVYYALLGAASAVGSLAAWWQPDDFVRLSSALLGGGAAAWATHLGVTRATGAPPSALALLAVLAGATGAGVVAQTWLHTRRRRREPREREREAQQAV
jgi:hypothetical protein